MLGILEICKGCRKRKLYVCQRSYNFKHLPLGKVTSEDKICKECKIKVVKGILKTSPNPKKQWKHPLN